MTNSKSFPLIDSSSPEVLIQRSSHFLGHLQKNWVTQNLPRYLLSLSGWKSCFKKSLFQPKSPFSSSFATPFFSYKSPSSILNCLSLYKIVLHSTSGKMYQLPKYCALLSLAFLTISCQTSTKVYSRKAVAAFKLSKLSPLGVKTTLRNLLKHEFLYKFYFLQASEHSSFMLKTQENATPLPLFPDILATLKNRSLKLPFKHRFNNVSLSQKLALLTLDKSVLFKKSAPLLYFTTFLPKGFLTEGPKVKEKKTKLQTSMFVYKSKLKLKKNRPQLCFTTTVAIKNPFVFNELDSLDYDAFSNLAGFEIMLVGPKLI